MTALQEQKFKDRFAKSETTTESVLSFLKYKGYISKYVKASEKEDREEAVDFHINDDPSQFKLRTESFKDVPVSFMQPISGSDRPMNTCPRLAVINNENCFGRDYLGLENGFSKHYYVATQKNDLYREVYRVSSEKLRKEVFELKKEWSEVKDFSLDGGVESRNPFWPFRFETLTSDRIWNLFKKQLLFKSSKGHEVKLHKNKKEKFLKINFYISETIKEEVFEISKKDAISIIKEF